MPFPIAPLRRFNESMMDEPTEVLRLTETEVEPGYPRTVWATVASTKSFGLDLSAQEQIVANQAGYRAQGRRYLPFGTDARPEDRLKVGSKTYDIESVNSETSPGLSAAVECLVSLRR